MNMNEPQTVLFISVEELRKMMELLPNHYAPTTKLAIVADSTRIKLLKPHITDPGVTPDKGDVLMYLPRTKF